MLKGLTAPGSDYDLITLDVDKFPEIAGEYKVCNECLPSPRTVLTPQVTALPTVVAFKDGKVKNKFSKSHAVKPY